MQFVRLLNTMKLLVLIILSLLFTLQQAHATVDETSPCRPIAARFCQGMSYNTTVYPRGVQGFNLDNIGKIVETDCSPDVATLMCRVVLPECRKEGESEKKPCRALCEKVMRDCLPTVKQQQLTWPALLQCSSLPKSNCDPGQSIYINPTARSTCEKINVPMCKSLHYTETVLPNILGHTTQEDVGLELHQFYPVVKVQCSAHIQQFLCSVYTPQCVEGKALRPCKILCEKAKMGCEVLLNKFGFQWPDSLRCEKFTTDSCEQSGVNVNMCEPITIPMCQGLSYDQTISPNLLGHQTQREAASHMSFFDSLVKTLCSVDIQFFICSVYAPKCVEGEAHRPCRSLCERAKRDCESLMTTFGVSWPEELQCESFPTEMCTQDIRPEMLNIESVLAKLNSGGYSVHGKSLSLETARLLLTLMDKDKSGYLDVVEFFKLELYVAPIRREYVESYESRIPPSVNEAQMKKSLSARDFVLDDATFRALWYIYHPKGGINYDEFVAVLTKLQILKDRFYEHLTNLPCDCQIASFSFEQFIKSAII
ncbi:uncharacterized protein LOC117514108 [Thalassophryne amazonica]|uniref:uncharacterized protein LOC117514108 n=1 Tax=Thalassophryne amazonica TaxID=390379 RepID=UPI001470D695|nr:uncharacterized protein LOC117514108 [Thalassophryne amazonica]